MAAISSSDATSSPRDAPMTLRRSAQWPTRKPAFTPRLSVQRGRGTLAKLDHFQGTPCLECGQWHALDSAIIRWV